MKHSRFIATLAAIAMVAALPLWYLHHLWLTNEGVTSDLRTVPMIEDTRYASLPIVGEVHWVRQWNLVPLPLPRPKVAGTIDRAALQQFWQPGELLIGKEWSESDEQLAAYSDGFGSSMGLGRGDTYWDYEGVDGSASVVFTYNERTGQFILGAVTR